ncbi:hypothetical protein CFOL_v3_31758, partial [Cephalotus follicularis]
AYTLIFLLKAKLPWQGYMDKWSNNLYIASICYGITVS